MSMTVILAHCRGPSDERFNSDPPGKLTDRQHFDIFWHLCPLRVKISTLATLCFMFYYIIYKQIKYKKLVKIWQKSEGPSLPRGLELNHSSKGPLKGTKITVMDILEFRDINEQDPYREIWF